MPVALGGAAVLAFFGRLLSPAVALATRDVPLYHLPLRFDLARLVRDGVPYWNPALHGGQPVLSNPGYSAFYPFSWLGLVLPPVYALNLLVLLHAAIAFSGTWVLARRLGAGRPASALAAVGYAGSGAFLSLLNAFTLFTSMAWFPWVMAFGDAALRAPGGWRGPAGRLRPALLAACALALQILNGEPVTVTISGLGLLALVVSAVARRPRAWRGSAATLALVGSMALGLAAAQVVPTWHRLADSPRAEPLPLDRSTVWSMPPARLVELIFPRFFGDPARLEENLFFGGGLSDHRFPYVVSPYSGLLLLLLALSALLRGPVPRHAAWAVGVVGGGFLALGRFNPLYRWTAHQLPLFDILRYPEKFVFLTAVSIVLAGALGWDRLLEERRRGHVERTDFPLALAAVVLATATAIAVVVTVAPRVADPLIRSGLPLVPAPGVLARGRAFLVTEAWAAVLTAATTAAVLILCRWRRAPGWLVAALALAVLTADLWHYDRGLITTLPAAELRQPPELARRLQGSPDRLFAVEAPLPDALPAQGRPGLRQLRYALARLEPYSGNLWGLSYALDPDYDLTLTRWARHAVELLAEARSDPAALARYLGAWNVGTWLVPGPLGGAEPVRALPNVAVLPRYRFLRRVVLHGDLGQAVAAVRDQGFSVAASDHWVSASAAGGEQALPRGARPALLAVRETGGRIDLDYRAATLAYLVAAVTFDPDWRGEVDGRAVRLYPTAIGQIGVVLPPGEHHLALRFVDPWVGVGAVSSGAFAVVLVLVFLAAGRRSGRPEAAAPAPT